MPYVNEQDIEKIIQQVLKNVEKKVQESENRETISTNKTTNTPPSSIRQENQGIFKQVEMAIEAAYEAQHILMNRFKQDDRQRFIEAIRRDVLDNLEELAQLIYEETKIGRYEDKLSKVYLAATKTPGVEDLTTEAISGDCGLTIEECAPYGVIGAVTPVTNPAETIINNSISMIAAGNSVVFNVHPSSKICSRYVVNLINQAIIKAEGPKNLVTMIENPTIETVQTLAKHTKVNLLVGTGGPKLVKALLSMGKKAIGAGAGNPPVIVDRTADVALAATGIIKGASFDNNILCIAEKEVFVEEAIYDDFIYHMLQNGAYMLNQKELEKVMELTLVADEKLGAKSCSCTAYDYHIRKEWVGQDATKILSGIGVNQTNTPLLICEVDVDHPYVQLEQMMPVLPIVKCRDIQEAINYAIESEHDNKHTASIYSTNLVNMTQFAKRINTTIFVKNAPTLAGVGFGGEGSATFTIAGPTGEGITSAKTYTRVRRCVLAEGGFRIV